MPRTMMALAWLLAACADGGVAAADDPARPGDTDALAGDSEPGVAESDEPVGDTDASDPDLDGDGHAASSDCDDEDAAVHPGAVETCNGADDDCDSDVDEDAVDAPTWYADADGDGVGGAATSVVACTAPVGFVASSGDCDDGDGSVHPGAVETCNGADDDCDSDVDEDAIDAPTWYADADGDGFGAGAIAAIACEAPHAGLVPDGTDCDDEHSSVYPGAPELCDERPNDCDDDAWTASDEDGRVSLYRPDGEWYDVTAAFTMNYVLRDGLYQLCAGTYSVRLWSPYASATLVGVHGAEATVIDAAGAGRGLEMWGGRLRVSGVTFANGAAGGDGGGIWVSDSTLSLEDVVVRDSVADGAGGGVYVAAWATVTIEDSTITGNRAGTDGGGVAGGPSLEILGGEVSLNLAGGRGGGVHVRHGSTVTLTGTRITGNEAVSGGGLSLDAGVTLTAVEVTGNAADEDGGGLHASLQDGEVNLDDAVVTDNVAGGRGGGLFVVADEGGWVHDTEGVYSENRSEGAGGGVYLDLGVIPGAGFDGTRVASNRAGGAGGGLFARGGTADLEDATIEDNSASGGGAGLRIVDTRFTMTDVVVASNDATSGSSTSPGGGLWLGGHSAAMLTRCRITGNNPSYSIGKGGGIAVEDAAGAHLIETVVSGNFADREGAGIWISGLQRSGVILAHDSEISNNGPGTGAGVFLGSGSLECRSSGIRGNWAKAGGTGGVHMGSEFATFEAENCDFGLLYTADDNRASGEAGPIYGQDLWDRIELRSLDDHVTLRCDHLGCD